jgi:hypothetical protein
METGGGPSRGQLFRGPSEGGALAQQDVIPVDHAYGGRSAGQHR